MPPARLRRSSPITLILAGILALGFLIFVLLPSRGASDASKLKHRGAASNPLSPPSLPFRKSKSSSERVPPPVVHYHLNNLTTSSTPIENRETVLILSPLVRFYPEYWENLLKLSYPHELISLGFIIPKTREGNIATSALQAAVAKTQSGPESKRFSSVTIIRQDFEPPLSSQNEAERHKLENQKVRRAAMARARNSLLFTTLGPTTSWVLWLDADIIETPPTLLQDLASHDKPIIVPNCYQRYINTETKKPDVRPYDYNSWQDSDTAQQIAQNMGNDEIIVEGYGEIATYRTLMAHLADTSANRDPTRLLPLDGVGGTALLVKADVHRDGAMFPPFPFYHLIETEGFAKMAKRLGWSSWGLPNYFVSLAAPVFQRG
jgi:mannan polymerase complexes MNN9 subunit